MFAISIRSIPLFTLAVIILLFISCIGQPKRSNTVYLAARGEMNFALDTATAQLNPVYFFERSDNKGTLALFNLYNSTVYFYDTETNENFKKTVVEKEGPDGIGKQFIKGFIVKSFDSLFILTSDNNLHILTSEGKKIRTIALNPFSDVKKQVFASAQSSFPGYCFSIDLHAFVGNQLYLTGFMDDSWGNRGIDSSGVLISVDLNNGDKKYYSSYPQVYHRGTWTPYYRFVFGTFNPVQKKYILSFPADHYVQVLDQQNYVPEKKYAGTLHFTGDIPPVRSSKNRRLEKAERDGHYYKNLCYRYIIYDKFRNVYYRFAELPVQNYVKGNTYYKQYSIIILNKDFEIIGETLLPEGKSFSPGVLFLTAAGLHIMKYTNNEDILTFSTYELIPITL